MTSVVRGGPNCLTAAWSSSEPVLPEPLAARALLNLMLLLLEAEAKSALEAAWRRDALIDKQKADRERSRLLVLVLSGRSRRPRRRDCYVAEGVASAECRNHGKRASPPQAGGLPLVVLCERLASLNLDASFHAWTPIVSRTVLQTLRRTWATSTSRDAATRSSSSACGPWRSAARPLSGPSHPTSWDPGDPSGRAVRAGAVDESQEPVLRTARSSIGSKEGDRRPGLLGMARAGIEPEASPEGEPREPVRAELFLRKDDAVGYWEGEPEPR